MKTNTSLFLALIVTAIPACAVVLVSTDFNNATLGAYANNANINASGALTERFKVAVNNTSPNTNKIEVVEISPGNRAVEFTNGSTGGDCYIVNTFNALPTSVKGNNYIEGRFDLTVLCDTRSPQGVYNPTFQFLVNYYFNTAGSNSSAIHTNFRASGSLNSTPSLGSDILVELYVPYRYEFYVDLSSDTQDTWGIKVTRIDNDQLLAERRGINTRTSNTTPERIVFSASANPSSFRTDPFIRLDNIHIEARNKILPTLMFLR